MALIAQDGVDLTPTESTELSHRAFAHRGNRADSKRALAIILLAAGDSYTEIQKAIGCSSQFVARWKARFLAERLAGLDPVEPEGRREQTAKQPRITPQQESRVLAKSRETPPNGDYQWTPESLGRALRHRRQAGRRRSGRPPASIRNASSASAIATDPRFEEKAADLVGLYVQGSQRVAVFALGDARQAAAHRNGNGREWQNGNGNGYGNGRTRLNANGRSNGHGAGDISAADRYRSTRC